MITLRPSAERGMTQIEWLKSWHSFSFGDYRDWNHMGFGVLRVINEDIVNPARGFGSHPHRDMEIITWVLESALTHKDSLGTGSVIVPGDAQRMSAGTGIVHSEFNDSPDKPVHLLQIWILPEREGLPPSYEQQNFTLKRKPGKLTLLASHDGREGSLTLHQDMALSVLDLDVGQEFSYPMQENRMIWAQVARGSASVNGQPLQQGDGAALTKENAWQFKALEKSEILLFDMAARSQL